ncbi:MAG: NAD(P)H-quinone oxidoreductase subunit 5 [Paraglaciecola sp.]|jgi:NAD(P)H-quinone oxidoreductase subunit 5
MSILLNNLLSFSWSLILFLPIIILVLSWLGISWLWLQRLLAGGTLLALVNWLLVVFLATTLALPNWLHIVPLTATLLLLVLFLALVVVRYAITNFEGDADQPRFLRWLVWVVFAVMVTVASNHLLVFWLAWLSISLSLHQLLMFYPQRPRAALAAHKKFILARVAELLLGLAFILLYSQHGTGIISDILAYYPAIDLHWQEQLAAVLLALVALIKCAQLPLHGWLIQVVDVPTPVSALLHAGVINLGGFVLLLFAPLFSQVLLAQGIILVVAGLSTVLSALIMMTRISIKVRLAWSTTAQMGLMLVECALGLYDLALLHLVAHSCYKAHAFLTAGEAVNHHLREQFFPSNLPKFRHYGAAILVVFALILGVSQIVVVAPVLSPWLLIGIALTMLLASRFNQQKASRFAWLYSILLVSGVLLTYLVLKMLAGDLLPTVSLHTSWLGDVWICVLILCLVTAYLVLQYWPAKAFSQRLFIALNAGLYLDEWATRYTLLLWPKAIPRTSQKRISTKLEIVK